MRKKIPIKWVFILPCIVSLLALTIFPLIWSLSLSFTKWKLAKAGRLTAPEFIGIDNFVKAFTKDMRFWSGLSFTVMYMAAATVAELLIGLGLASILAYTKFIGRKFFRVIYIVPMACPPLGLALVWRMLLHEDVGPINQLLVTFGLGRVHWLTRPFWARFALIMVDIWEWTPFMFLALLAAIQSLPLEPFEAAVIDGASRWQTFRHITLPMLRSVIATLVIIRAIDAFKLYDLIFGITGGGPGLSTESSSYYIYIVGLSYFDFGYASALSYVFLVITLLLSITLLTRLRKAM